VTGQEVEIVQNVLMVLIQVAIPPLLLWGLAELKRHFESLRQRDEWYQVEMAVSRAVTAAEQLGLTDQLTQYGEQKLDVAIQFVEAQLAAAGVPLDVDVYADAVRAMIEAEVQRQFG